MISVIIPVYNSADYLDKCIESVLEQSYRSFELILVDDGSTDDSGVICDKWNSKDNRIKVIHQSNKGVSSARNNGIKVAKGEYFTFIDSDDWVKKDYLSDMIAATDKYESVDLVVSGIIQISGQNNEKKISSDLQLIIEMQKSYANDFLRNIELFYGPVTKLYSAKIIRDNNLLFPEDFSLGEDLLFNFKYLEHVGRIAVLPVANYFYLQLPTSNVRIYRKNRFDIHYYEWHVQVNFLQRHGMWNERAEQLFSQKMWAMVYEGVFSFKKPTIAYLKRLLSIKEIQLMKVYRNVFQTKLWIKTLILSRSYFILYLIRLIKG